MPAFFRGIPIPDMTDNTWDEVMDVNARGTFAGACEAARRMIAAARGGVIINIVSTAGFKGVAPGAAAYAGSKHAVRGLTRQIPRELAPHGIRVFGVAPTYCLTEGNHCTCRIVLRL